jgi:hypothetical protein
MVYGFDQSNLCSRKLGYQMRFQRVVVLANNTPGSVLCEAWGESLEYVDARKRAETPLTIREAGSLAELHGLRLEDVLTR